MFLVQLCAFHKHSPPIFCVCFLHFSVSSCYVFHLLLCVHTFLMQLYVYRRHSQPSSAAASQQHSDKWHRQPSSTPSQQHSDKWHRQPSSTAIQQHADQWHSQPASTAASQQHSDQWCVLPMHLCQLLLSVNGFHNPICQWVLRFCVYCRHSPLCFFA